MMPTSGHKSVTDPITVVTYFFLVISGIIMLYAVGRPPEGYASGDVVALLTSFAGKQFIWLIISLGAWFVVDLFIDRQTWVVVCVPYLCQYGGLATPGPGGR